MPWSTRRSSTLGLEPMGNDLIFFLRQRRGCRCTAIRKIRNLLAAGFPVAMDLPFAENVTDSTAVSSVPICIIPLGCT